MFSEGNTAHPHDVFQGHGHGPQDAFSLVVHSKTAQVGDLHDGNMPMYSMQSDAYRGKIRSNQLSMVFVDNLARQQTSGSSINQREAFATGGSMADTADVLGHKRFDFRGENNHHGQDMEGGTDKPHHFYKKPAGYLHTKQDYSGGL